MKKVTFYGIFLKFKISQFISFIEKSSKKCIPTIGMNDII